jgi:hypothetical protein
MTTTRTPQSMTNVAKQTVVLALMGMLLAGVEIYFLVSAVLYRGPSMSVLPGQIAKVLAIAVLIWVVFLIGQGRGESKIRTELDTDKTKLDRARKQMNESANPFEPKRFARVLLVNAVLIFAMNIYWDWNFALLIGLAILVVTLVTGYLTRLSVKMFARERVERAAAGQGGVR